MLYSYMDPLGRSLEPLRELFMDTFGRLEGRARCSGTAALRVLLQACAAKQKGPDPNY